MTRPTVAVLVLACAAGCSSRKSAAPDAARAGAEFLAATEEARGEVPALTWKAAHTDEEYLKLEGPKLGPARLFVRPMDPSYIDSRVAQIPADFERALGKKVTPEQAKAWGQAMIEDLDRRRVILRALMDLNLDGKLDDYDLGERGARLAEGIPLAFRRITGITKEEHDKL